jgi:DNA-binding transcriptional MerR regulator
LEYWVLIGVVEPLSEPHGVKVFRRFTQEDLEILLQVKKLTDEGVLVSRAAEKVKKERKKEEPL